MNVYNNFNSINQYEYFSLNEKTGTIKFKGEEYEVQLIGNQERIPLTADARKEIAQLAFQIINELPRDQIYKLDTLTNVSIDKSKIQLSLEQEIKVSDQDKRLEKIFTRHFKPEPQITDFVSEVSESHIFKNEKENLNSAQMVKLKQLNEEKKFLEDQVKGAMAIKRQKKVKENAKIWSKEDQLQLTAWEKKLTNIEKEIDNLKQE